MIRMIQKLIGTHHIMRFVCQEPPSLPSLFQHQIRHMSYLWYMLVVAKYDICHILPLAYSSFYFHNYCTSGSYFGHFETSCPSRNTPSFTMSSSIGKSQVIKQQQNHMKMINVPVHCHVTGVGEVAFIKCSDAERNSLDHSIL